jgi:hypothetical protein
MHFPQTSNSTPAATYLPTRLPKSVRPSHAAACRYPPLASTQLRAGRSREQRLADWELMIVDLDKELENEA